MKKSIIGVVAVIVIIAIIIGVVFILSKNKEEKPNKNSAVEIQTAEEMEKIINDINTKLGENLPAIETRQIDITDEYAFTSSTGLKSNSNVEAVVVSEPFMSSQAHSAVMIKTKENANIEEMKQEIYNNIDMRKWICVSAEKLWITNYNDIIFFVMSSEEWGKPVYDEFKQAVGGTVGKELEKAEEF